MSDDIVNRLRGPMNLGGYRVIGNNVCNDAADEIERLRALVARLREALAFYADRETWRGDPCPAHSDVDGDFVATVGKKARAALKETER